MDNLHIQHKYFDEKNNKIYINDGENNNLHNRVKNLVNRYIKLDQAYRLKHEELKTMYDAFKLLHKKYKNAKMVTEENDCQQKINSIVSEMKQNDQQMYHQRLIAIKQIREDNTIPEEDKKFVAKKMEVVYRNPRDYKPIQNVEPVDSQSKNNRVPVSKLDTSYINKHNELMQMFKAYKNLYGKTLNYKSKLDDYKTLSVKSSISNTQMDKMLKDQKFVMESLEKMQNELIKKDILRHDEKVPTTPVISNVSSIGMFNDNLRNQINNKISKNNNVSPKDKQVIDKILGSHNNSFRNDKIRELILLKRLNK